MGQHNTRSFRFWCAIVLLPDDIDVALLRRFHSRIFVGPPSHKERIEMIANFMDGIQHCLDDKQVMSLADRIPGWSGSDIKVHLQYKRGCRVGRVERSNGGEDGRR